MDTQISPGIVSFHDFRFDIDCRRLWQQDTAGTLAPVAAGSRTLEVLAILLRQPGVLITKDTIMRQVWPNTAVEPNNLTVQITALRRVLDANPTTEASCIQTVPGRGYRFVAPVTRPSERLPEGAPPAPTTIAPPAPERRQLTVMAFNMVDLASLSPRLDLEDQRALRTAWQRCCADIIQRHHGVVASYTIDGGLAWFGYPRANEHDAERAVRAGLALIEAIPQLTASGSALHARIGIATGLVIVTAPAGADQTVTAVGSTLHVAAQMQARADADQIVIAASTRRLIGNGFALTHLGSADDEPARAWRVERALATESRFDALHGGAKLTPLVGRDEELDLLLRRWSQAQEGEGQVVLLSGEPGIGKSRILSTLLERLETTGAQAIRTQCLPHYVNSPFWPIIDNFERTLKFSRDDTLERKLDRLEALIVTRYRRPVSDVRFVASILNIPCGHRYGTLQITPRQHKNQTLRTLVDITEAAARKQPSVLLFEDAHWADPTTLEVLDLLIDRVKTIPLLLVITHRPEFQPRWSDQGHVGALNLTNLTRTQSAAIVSALAGDKALPPALREQILTRTDGVPLFVEELTRAILESGDPAAAGDPNKYAGPARAFIIPATLRDSLMARLDRFLPVKEIAQIGAAIGRAFSYELIAAVAPMPQAQLDESLAKLTRSGLAFRRGAPPDAVYTFRHALIQDAAYDSLLKSHRQALHGKIAGVIETRFPHIAMVEPEVLARHCTEAGLADAAIALWQQAGDLALQRWALTDALSHLNQALQLMTALPWSPEREARELQLRQQLVPVYAALRGSLSSDPLSHDPRPGRAQAKLLEGERALLPVLWGLTIRRSAPGIYRRSVTGNRSSLLQRDK